MVRPVIVVHGGAGNWPENKQRPGLEGVTDAAIAGSEALRDGGSSLDAVETAVASMEEDQVFNAGTGARLNLTGNVEADAAIMDGSSLRGGGVALVRSVRNPVRLARLIMERTDHVLVAGSGAERLAWAHGLDRKNLRIHDRAVSWRKEKTDFQRGKLSHLARNYRLFKRGLLGTGDTVGALAIDFKGNLAAACSTGGLSLKLPGRIGDSAILGAGLYADNELGAATATGIGEIAIRMAVSKAACDLMSKKSAAAAARFTISMVSSRVGRGLGVITLDRKGRYGVAHNTRHLIWATARERGEPIASLTGTRLH